MGSILSRIQELAINEGITIGALERKIGASKGVLSRAINNGTDIQAKWLTILVENYPNYSPSWILTGKGNMIISQNTDMKNEELPVAHRTESNEGIPLIPINAMAGAFTGDQSVMEYECDRYIIPSFKGADFLIGVKGSSMYPRYNSGDIVACKRLNLQDLFFQWNKVYVLDTDQGPLIKRIKPGTDKGHVTIVSDNKDYEPFELAIDHIYHVALVVGVIRVE
ncbi:S24 family peptidase [Phocaeicola plebeius]|uniref:S24 family peptidase n=1 Tax=Phocaeicola plebeius TaxID=310297 RepID=UPI0026EB422F|nr:S24 family peptidase [Phocaeicola plebeius]